MKIAYVELEDAGSVPGYLDDYEDLEPMKVTSCGLLVRSDKRAVVLSLDHFEDGDRFREGLVIPRPHITKLTILEGKDQKKKG